MFNGFYVCLCIFGLKRFLCALYWFIRLNWVKNTNFEERYDDDGDGGDESDKNIEARDEGSRA